MADSNAVGGLQWVKDEIVTSLQRVRGWLDELVEREGGQSRLNDAVTTLSEVRGLLSGLQLIGPTRLTEEMQTLCEDLQAESLPNRGEVAEALILALIQLPDYLDKLGDDQEDIPMALLPSINDLRGSRGAAPLSEAELLVPASVLAESEMLAADVRRSLGKIAAKVRPHFHRYLLQWLMDDRSRQGLVGLVRLFHRLQRYIGAGIFHELFLVAEAVAEALLDGSIAADTRTKTMIAHLDRVINSLGADPDAWPEADAQSQLFDLLSLIANSESSSYRVKELRSTYGLEPAAEGGEPVSALAAVPSSSRTIGEVPPAGEEPDAGAAERPTPITAVKHIDPELRDPGRRVAKIIPWPAPGRVRTDEMETLRDLAVDLEERIARLEPGGAADHIPSKEGPGEL